MGRMYEFRAPSRRVAAPTAISKVTGSIETVSPFLESLPCCVAAPELPQTRARRELDVLAARVGLYQYRETSSATH
jgi:hypothetical protein